jgi:HCOMODA/2-hydroxy-3-carboxy-muconic semialdehyde decarboxylase
MRAPGQLVEMEVRLAARALARHGLVHAYGHVSARVDTGRFVVTPAHPLGRVGLTTRLVACALEEPLPEGALPEVRIHQEIYRVRPDVGAVCRFQSPKIIALSAIRRTPRALHGLGAYFAPEPPLWDDPLLVRDSERAARVAHMLADGRAIVLRGNGAVTVGATAREAAAHAFFLEDAATMELHVLSSGARAIPYTAEQALQRAAPDKRLYDRMWEFLVGDDAAPSEVQS